MATDEVEVFRGTGGEPERAFYEAVLREAGVACVLKGPGISQHPMNVGPMSDFVILVAPEDQERARRIISELQEPVAWSEDEDDEEDEAGVRRRFSRESTPGERRVFVALSILFLLVTAYLLVPLRVASLWAILALTGSAFFFAASRRA